MVNPIVKTNVTTQTAPAPSQRQRTGALLSAGGTNTVAGTLSLLTQLSDLTPLLEAAQAVTLAQSAGLATGTVSGGHGWTTGDVILATITGALPVAYNGLKTITVTSSTQFTFAISSGTSSPATGSPFVILADEAELLNMATTFFAQGSGLSVYVLELGETTATEGVAYLTTWITNNPGVIYSYVVPAEWDVNAAFLTFLGTFESTTAKTYFFITSTTGNQNTYTALMKCAFVEVQSPTAPATEFSVAASFWDTLNFNPGSTNKVTPLAFSFQFGVTPYPTSGNATALTTLLADNCNYVGDGSEGGLSDAILRNGRLKDGNPFNYWYSIDWASINLDLTVTNTVINGSNDPINPLIYNQAGINTLQDAATSVLKNAVTYGLANGPVVQTQLPIAQFIQNFQNGLYDGQIVCNAEPYSVYVAENPSDEPIGKYAGLAVVYRVARGFEQIIIDVIAINF